MFRGASSIAVDSKGRIAIPTRYRNMLLENCEGQLVCTIDIQQKCLLLYPLYEWEEVEEHLRSLSSTHPGERRVKRLLLGYANEIEMDRSGRLLLAPVLREHIQLSKQAMLVGQMNKFEIWDEAAWKAQIEQDLEDQAAEDLQLSERLQDFSY